MENNTISVTAYLANGGLLNILDVSIPNDAIENYFCPDMRPPVQTLVIKAKTDENKTVLMTITKNSIHVKVD